MPRGEGNPQLEDGFARIAVEILEAIARTPLTDYESRCVHWLWRQTYGWRDQHGQAKKVDKISYSQWADATNISRRTVFRVLNRLAERRIFSRKAVPNARLIEWGFNKHWKQWVLSLETTPETEEVLSSEQIVSSETTGVLSPQTTQMVSSHTPTKDNKDTFKLLLRLGAVDLLKFLQELPNWKGTEDDGHWLLDFLDQYKEFDIKRAKACRDWWSGKHEAKEKGAWKNRLRNWLEKGRKIEKDETNREMERQAGQPRQSGRSTRPGRVPSDEDLDDQFRRYGIGRKNDNARSL